MRSPVKDVLPSKVRRALRKLGHDLATARRKRRLTALMMAERLAVARTTYLKIEKGDPSVSMGAYAMALFVLGFGEALGDIVDPRRDDVGLLLDTDRLPKRIRPRKASNPL
jgi:DNA-binding XRE family transcriptional regulator